MCVGKRCSAPPQPCLTRLLRTVFAHDASQMPNTDVRRLLLSAGMRHESESINIGVGVPSAVEDAEREI